MTFKPAERQFANRIGSRFLDRVGNAQHRDHSARLAAHGSFRERSRFYIRYQNHGRQTFLIARDVCDDIDHSMIATKDSREL